MRKPIHCSTLTPSTVTCQVAWVICAGYGAALHLIAAVRATHYLSFPRVAARVARLAAFQSCSSPHDHSSNATGDVTPLEKALAADGKSAAGVSARLRAWWLFAAGWPCLAYLLPLLDTGAEGAAQRIQFACRRDMFAWCCLDTDVLMPSPPRATARFEPPEHHWSARLRRGPCRGLRARRDRHQPRGRQPYEGPRG